MSADLWEVEGMQTRMANWLSFLSDFAARQPLFGAKTCEPLAAEWKMKKTQMSWRTLLQIESGKCEDEDSGGN